MRPSKDMASVISLGFFKRSCNEKLQKFACSATFCSVYYTIWSSLVAQMVKNLPARHETWVHSPGQEDPCRREWKSTPVFLSGKFILFISWGLIVKLSLYLFFPFFFFFFFLKFFFSSLPIPSLWVVPVHQPQASSIVHRTTLSLKMQIQSENQNPSLL